MIKYIIAFSTAIGLTFASVYDVGDYISETHQNIEKYMTVAINPGLKVCRSEASRFAYICYKSASLDAANPALLLIRGL